MYLAQRGFFVILQDLSKYLAQSKQIKLLPQNVDECQVKYSSLWKTKENWFHLYCRNIPSTQKAEMGTKISVPHKKVIHFLNNNRKHWTKSWCDNLQLPEEGPFHMPLCGGAQNGRSREQTTRGFSRRIELNGAHDQKFQALQRSFVSRNVHRHFFRM